MSTANAEAARLKAASNKEAAESAAAIKAVAAAEAASSPLSGVLGSLTFGDMAKIGIPALLSVGFYIASFAIISQFVGSRDGQNQIKPEINKILATTILGSFFLFLALLMYFIKDPGNIIYIVLIMTCITLALSYSALAISAISK
jgi:hypothetical protein